MSILLMLSAVAGCATPPTDPAERVVFEQNSDPLEPMNRKILAVNQLLDRVLFTPVAKVYVAVFPEAGRDAMKRVLDNMKEPTLLINNLLQGQFTRGEVTLGRFAINTSVGLLGVVDVAAKLGLDRRAADFGQTLFVWGVPSGPYLILPLFGPSNPRDAIGLAIDSQTDPATILAHAYGIEQLTIARFAASGVDERARVIDVLDDLQKNSLDFYAELRSLSQQKRNGELYNGKPPTPGTDLYTDPGRGGSDATAPPAMPAAPRPVGAAPGAAPASAPASAPLRWETTDPEEGPIVAPQANSARP
jgi:phospholipid-binding lipoprotein MlaA